MQRTSNPMRRMGATVVVGLALLAAAAAPAGAKTGSALLRAYPDQLERIDGNWLVWRDGTRMPLRVGGADKTPAERLDAPDLLDMLAQPYAPSAIAAPPPPDHDPGRARNAAFFAKMYGDCRKGEVAGRLVTITWLPQKAGQRIAVTRVNGVAERLTAISAELDRLPARFDAFLRPAAGGYNCRAIAGEGRLSPHGFGIAFDLAPAAAQYWRWTKSAADGGYPYRNTVPIEIVRVFERHGFIWGGRWHHYDTMHFEYRPELLPPAPP